MRTKLAVKASKSEPNWPEGPVHQNQTSPKGQYIRTKLARTWGLNWPGLNWASTSRSNFAYINFEQREILAKRIQPLAHVLVSPVLLKGCQEAQGHFEGPINWKAHFEILEYWSVSQQQCINLFDPQMFKYANFWTENLKAMKKFLGKRFLSAPYSLYSEFPVEGIYEFKGWYERLYETFRLLTNFQYEVRVEFEYYTQARSSIDSCSFRLKTGVFKISRQNVSLPKISKTSNDLHNRKENDNKKRPFIN